MDDLLSIGRFARITGLTIGALRHYDELGLLAPARVDPATSYRTPITASRRATRGSSHGYGNWKCRCPW